MKKGYHKEQELTMSELGLSADVALIATFLDSK